MFSYNLGDGAELRPLEERYADELFALTDRNRDHLRQWLGWVDIKPNPAATSGFLRGAMLQWAENNGFQAGIWFNGSIAGVVGHNRIDWGNRATELGYWLGAEFQGHGLMTRACHAMIDYAFAVQQLQRVVIHCAVDNARSRAIPERLGFTQEGVLRQAEWLHDHFVDLAVYSMLREEWGRPETEDRTETQRRRDRVTR
ncbi:MAG: GNAT family N-acetyltransferase [Chloroflexaceae bacterium]|jgi:ribosomal-protein-serine acetyltransferase|nr:GNAT family N-acetyltransferase [Chloroflexaceae bacterium]